MSNAKPIAAIAQISHWTGVSRDAAMGSVAGLLRIPRARTDRCTRAAHADFDGMPPGAVDAGRGVTELIAGPELLQRRDEGAFQARAARSIDDRSAGGAGQVDEEVLDAGVARLRGRRDRDATCRRRAARLAQQASPPGHH